MASELFVVAALANCGRDAPTDQFVQSLIHTTPDLAMFRFRPSPGGPPRAALDWQGILGTAADILAFAGVLWTAYERYVTPKLGGSDRAAKPVLFVQLYGRDRTKFVQFSLGGEYNDKEILIERFTRQVTELRAVAGAGRRKVTATKSGEDRRFAAARSFHFT